MPAIDIKGWMGELSSQLSECRQRQLVVLRGAREWCDRHGLELLDSEAGSILFSDRELAPRAIRFAKADSCLGGETRLAVLDLFSGFNPDVLCIAAGLVRESGVLLLLAPELEDWDMSGDVYGCWQEDHHAERAWFAEYFFAELDRDGEIGLCLGPGASAPALPPLPVLAPTPIENGQTAEQRELQRQIEDWYRQNQAAVALVSADRGRGKSTLLGMLVNRLQASARILVSAASRGSAAVLLREAPTAEFVAPDRLLQQAPAADLLVVDEAAAIPLSILQQLERIYPRLLLATTSGGYEGTGQGFMLKFVAALGADRLQQYRLHTPVRWCGNDLLEGWLNRTLMLQATDAPQPPQAETADCDIELIANPGDPARRPLLREVYRLLNTAHYRTRPSDLRMLMENPDQVLVVARRQDLVAGVALLNLEGGFESGLCAEVFLGRRRPRGHLLAQMLTAQAGIREFAAYRGIRVQRIAVSPAWRRRGLGTRLIERACTHGRELGCDYLGACFALDPETAPFWQSVGCELAHVSFAPGKSSGNQSIAVLRALDPGVDDDLERLRLRLQRQLPLWMTQFLAYLQAEQAVSLLRLARFHAELSRHELDEVEAFACGNRGFDLSFASLQKFVMSRLAQGDGNIDPLLIEKAVQNRDWRLLVRETDASGRKQLLRRLRGLVEALFKD